MTVNISYVNIVEGSKIESHQTKSNIKCEERVFPFTIPVLEQR